MEADTTKVLLVCKDAKLSSVIKQVLTAPLFALTEMADFNEARRRLMEESFGIIIADFADGEGQDFVAETGGLPSASYRTRCLTKCHTGRRHTASCP